MKDLDSNKPKEELFSDVIYNFVYAYTRFSLAVTDGQAGSLLPKLTGEFPDPQNKKLIQRTIDEVAEIQFQDYRTFCVLIAPWVEFKGQLFEPKEYDFKNIFMGAIKAAVSQRNADQAHVSQNQKDLVNKISMGAAQKNRDRELDLNDRNLQQHMERALCWPSDGRESRIWKDVMRYFMQFRTEAIEIAAAAQRAAALATEQIRPSAPSPVVSRGVIREVPVLNLQAGADLGRRGKDSTVIQIIYKRVGGPPHHL